MIVYIDKINAVHLAKTLFEDIKNSVSLLKADSVVDIKEAQQKIQESIISLLGNNDAKIIEMLIKECYVVFNFSKTELSEDSNNLVEKESLFFLLQLFTSNRGNSSFTGFEFRESQERFFPPRLKNGSVDKSFFKNYLGMFDQYIENKEIDYDKYDSLSAIYLIDSKSFDHDIKTPLLIGTEDSSIQTLRNVLFRDGKTMMLFNLQARSSESVSFGDWSVLKENDCIKPSTDIIVVDRYLFKPKISSDGKYRLDKEEDIVTNIARVLQPMIDSQICPEPKIVFIMDGYPEDMRNDKMCKLLRAKLREYNPMTRVSFKFFIEKQQHPHDRFIISNYTLYVSGDSMQYSDLNNHLITNGHIVSVYSRIDNNVSMLCKSVLQHLRRLTCVKDMRYNEDGINSNLIESFNRI